LGRRAQVAALTVQPAFQLMRYNEEEEEGDGFTDDQVGGVPGQSLLL
jgi:hypothetical protein